MESQSPDLSLDLSPPWLAGVHKKEPDKTVEPPSYVSRLEEELKKIESFKRELPLSVMLLNDAIGRLKKEVGTPGSENTGSFDGDKKSWMSSVQLWSSDQTLSLQLDSKKSRDGAEEGQVCRYTDDSGALSSFHTGSDVSPAIGDDDSNKPLLAGSELRLQITSEPAAGLGGVVEVSRGGEKPSVRVSDQAKLRYLPSPASALQGSKKHRRCWSPELHRQFIDALERLGGSQVATPKQIRDLMQVDGLTNDEVKSHLQKYRLHIRKLPTIYSRGGCLKAEVVQSGSPQGPLHMATRSGNCNSSASRSRCNSNEDEDEERSDSHSWKGNDES